MEPWTVVTTLSVLAALAAAVGGPLVKLNGTIARLSAMLEHVLHRLDMLGGGRTAICGGSGRKPSASWAGG